MRKLLSSVLLVVLTLSGLAAVSPPAVAGDTGMASAQSGRVVSTEPGKNAPNILDGTVYSITQVGDTIVVGGQFTQAQNYNTSAVVARANVLAFDASTGKLITSFAPNPNGTVYKVLPAADGHSVYVAGGFTSAAGTSMPGRLFKIDVATGVVDRTFTAPTISGDIRDLELVGNHLFLAGKFTHINGVAQQALGTVYADSGKRDPYFNAVLAGIHNPNLSYAKTNVLQIATDHANRTLVAVGNFMTVDGQSRIEVARFDISNAPTTVNTTVHQTLSPWSTTLYSSLCSKNFETNMTDVELSPDGTYFVVSTTGAWGGTASNSGTSGCDVAARFENNAVAGSAPTWTSYTGGDTTWTVEVTEDAIYAGGHMRWFNNPTAGDKAGQGAVAREGIAALSPVNGLPYSWNPTRARGVGVQDMLATDTGLYVGSDTELIGPTPGNQYHARIAVFPLAGGSTLPAQQATTLPVDVYKVASGATQLQKRSFTGTSAGTATNVPTGPGWGTATGAFMVNGVLYKVNSDGSVSQMTFDGTTYGVATPVSTADAIVYQTSWHTDARTITSLFYSAGNLYYTLSGSNALYRRAFEVEDGVVGQQRFSTTTNAINWSTVRGAFVASGKLYYATTAGSLYSATWNEATHNLTGTASQVTGAGTGWASRAMFPYQAMPAAANEPPTASAAISCDQLTCRFDGSGSTDPENRALKYDWDFGDGTAHGTSATVTHTYSSAGDRAVTLTVTDDKGATNAVTRTASPTSQADPVSFVGTQNTNGNRANHSVDVPSGTRAGDALLLFLTTNSTGPVYAAPAGWTLVQSANGNSAAGRLWTRTATAADLGSTVTVTSRNTDGSTYTVKSDLTLAAYRGASRPTAADSAITTQGVATTVHQTPTVNAADGTSWLVSYWADKSASTTSWTGPAGQTQRSQGTATGAAHVTSLLMDSGKRVATGTQGGLGATADSSAQGLTISVLLHGSGSQPANQPPVARASLVGCTGLTCSVDGGSSTDPDGDALTYDWNWGDATAHGSGATASHTWSSAGNKTVTLTVTDAQGASSTDAVTATPSEATANTVAFVGASSTQGNRQNHTAPVPAGTRAGDTLVAFFTANTLTPTYDGPAGWSAVEDRDGTGITTRAWTRTATASDLGSNVTVTSSGYAKSDLTVAAYRATTGSPTIAASASATDNSAGATHVSPAVTATAASSWLVTYWADKADDTTHWTAPSGQTVRAAPTTATGSAHVTPLLVDSNGPVPAGASGTLTATASSTSARGASISLLIRAP